MRHSKSTLLDSCLGCRHVSYPSPKGTITITAVLVSVKPRGTVTVRAAASESQCWTAAKGRVLTFDEAKFFGFRDLDPRAYVGPTFEDAPVSAYGRSSACPDGNANGHNGRPHGPRGDDPDDEPDD